MAAAGGLRVNDLAGNSFAHLVDRRHKSRLEIQASFAFTPSSLRDRKAHSLYKEPLPDKLHLTSRVSLERKETSPRAQAWYGDENTTQADTEDPLYIARARELHLWFVIGYGVQRTLPETGRIANLARPSVDRMKPLFDPSYPLTSTAFISHYGARQTKARIYSNTLKRAIVNTRILPNDIANLEIRGYGGVTKATPISRPDVKTQSPHVPLFSSGMICTSNPTDGTVRTRFLVYGYDRVVPVTRQVQVAKRTPCHPGAGAPQRNVGAALMSRGRRALAHIETHASSLTGLISGGRPGYRHSGGESRPPLRFMGSRPSPFAG